MCKSGVPAKPEIIGLSRPAQEGEDVTLTCTTSGSKPAADIRWFRNDKEVQGKQIPPDSLELIVCNEQLRILSVCNSGDLLRLQGKLGFPYNVKTIMVKYYVLLC